MAAAPRTLRRATARAAGGGHGPLNRRSGGILTDAAPLLAALKRRLRLALVDPIAVRRLAASGLFDADWYLQRYPDVRTRDAAALRHYLAFGWREGRDPNPLFSTRWYRSNTPDAEGREPLAHYLAIGEREGRAPSPGFDPAWYAARYADVAEAGTGLLRHYLERGRSEGRSGAPPLETDAGEPVANAWLCAEKPLLPSSGGLRALLVCHAVDGGLKPHVVPYVRQLAQAGFGVVLIAMAEGPVTVDPALTATLAGLYVRENRGLDFAAWAHLLREAPSLFAADALLLANDSVLARPRELAAALGRMLAKDADLVGLTESFEAEWHVQSYLLLLRPGALGAIAFQRFVFDVRMLGGKDGVIGAYELRLASTLRGAGLRCEALHPADRGRRDNPTIRRWRALLADGYPFVKLSVLQGREPEVDMTGWEATLAGAGFDMALVDRLRVPAPPAHDPPLQAPCPIRGRDAGEPLRIEYLGRWAERGAAGDRSRTVVSALLHQGVRLNLWPLPPVDHAIAPLLEAIDFDGPADAALLDLDGGAPPPGLHPVLPRAGHRIGVSADAGRPPPDGFTAMLALDPDETPSELAERLRILLDTSAP